MQTRTPQKNGVLGVHCVPCPLKASIGGAFSDGTLMRKRLNTKHQEHDLCSVPWIPARPASALMAAVNRAREFRL